MILDTTCYPDRIVIRGTHDGDIARYVAAHWGLHYLRHHHTQINGWPHTVVEVRV